LDSTKRKKFSYKHNKKLLFLHKQTCQIPLHTKTLARAMKTDITTPQPEMAALNVIVAMRRLCSR